MDLPIIQMDADEASEHAAAYRTIEKPTDEERAIMAGYLALAAGKQVVNLPDVIRSGGMDHRGWPRLAVMDALGKYCYLRAATETTGGVSSVRWRFAPRQSWDGRGTRGTRRFDGGPTPEGFVTTWGNEVRAMVPVVPPEHRPTYRGRHVLLTNYVIVWEVEKWERVPQPPGDPALLRPLWGDLWTVESIWDLTPLEQAVLSRRNAE